VQLAVSVDDLLRVPIFRLDAFVREAAHWQGAMPVSTAAAAACESVGTGTADGVAERALDSHSALDRVLQLSQIGRNAAALACCQHALRYCPGSPPPHLHAHAHSYALVWPDATSIPFRQMRRSCCVA
jgi:hypothetical protein